MKASESDTESRGSGGKSSRKVGSASPGSTIGAVLWMLCFQFFAAEQLARVHVQGPYSIRRNAISDLGAVHRFSVDAATTSSFSPWHSLMNVSFVLQGLLIFFGAALLWRCFSGHVARAGFLAITLAGAGVFVVGLFPEDSSGQVHVLGATIHFVCGSLAMLLLGHSLLRSSRIAGALSMIAGAVALAATLLLGLRNTAVWSALGWTVGAVERVAAYPLPLWLTVAGVVLLTHRPTLQAAPVSPNGTSI